MFRYLSVLCFIALFICLGCDSVKTFKVDIPKDFNGEWNLKGKLAAKNDPINFDVNQNISIDDGKVLLEGGEEWEAAKVGRDINIGFSILVSDEDVAGCGKVRTMADATIIIPVVKFDESQYDGIAVGIFRINSDCDGESSKELGGDFILKRR